MPRELIQNEFPGQHPTASISIRNLRLRTYIGFNEDELEKKQDVVINIEISYAAREGILEDRVEDALDYKVVTKAVINLVERGRFLLLEKLVADVLAVCSEHPDILRARVTADKPHALRFADSVSLSMEYSAKPTTHLRLLERAS